MIKKILILLLFLNASCGYQPMYLNKVNKEFEFKEIQLDGNKSINKKILSATSFKEIKTNKLLNKIIFYSDKKITETSKNSKGQVTSYRTSIKLLIKILDNKNKIITEKNFEKQFSYNVKSNKFELKEYQIQIENDLTNKIIEELITFMNL